MKEKAPKEPKKAENKIGNNSTSKSPTQQESDIKTTKEQKKDEKNTKNSGKHNKKKQKSEGRTIFTWTFALFLILISLAILCFINKVHTQRLFQTLQTKADSLQYKYIFYKNAYVNKDSAYNILYTEYNNLLQEKLSQSQELASNKEELLRLQRQLRAKDSILNAVENAVKQALVGFNSDELNIEIKNGKLYVTMRNKLLFPSGSDKIPRRGYRALRKLAKILKDNPNLEITIEGHTDNLAIKNKRFKDNWDLSAARAIAVARVLINKYGVPPERITVAGRSMYSPVAPNTTKIGRAKNRRIEIILYPNVEYLAKIIE